MPQGTTVNPDVDTLIEEAPELVERAEGPPPSFSDPPFGDDGDGRDDQPEPPINNARLGVMLFIGAEGMFFAGLLSAFLVFRTGSTVWPPPFQPRLPLVVTSVNTFILLYSSYTMHRALRAIRRGNAQGLVDWVTITALLGMIFLGVQGYEWAWLLQFGLTLSSSVYGATFYILIGCHAAHVFGAVIWLLFILAMAKTHRFTHERFVGVQVCGIYWYFVVTLWPILFGLVYLY
ncbi:MAG: cytochrome c oxidase subunit 3 [Candidatus Entotheonellia bacterium]